MKKLIVIIILIAGIYYFMSDSENEPDTQDQSILIDDSALKALEDAKQLVDDAADRADNMNNKSLDELLKKPGQGEQTQKALDAIEKVQAGSNEKKPEDE